MGPTRLALTGLLVLGLSAFTVQAQERRRDRQTLEGVNVVRGVEYGRGGGRALLLDIYRPGEKPAGRLPAVVWIHGGGWRAGSRSNAENAVYLAKHGYVSASIDYRLSGEAKFPAAVEDCKCAVRWLRAHADEYGVDPDRIGVWGSSAGGHLALMTGLAAGGAGLEGTGGWQDVPSRVKAVCSWFGPADFTLNNGAPGPRTGGVVAAFLGGAPGEVPELYARASPVTHVSADDPPVFLVHGERDEVVQIEQSEGIYKKLRDAGIETSFLRVKNAGHGFKPADGGDVTPSVEEIRLRVLEFFDEHLRGAEDEKGAR